MHLESPSNATDLIAPHRPPRLSTGIAGLDQITGGGYPFNRIFLVHGRPGSGKTTLALQFLRAGAEAGEPVVYLGLSESEVELRDIAGSHGWSLDGLTICDVQAGERRLEEDSEYTFFHPSEIELTDTTRTILEVLERIRPRRVVFDSLSELRLIARDSLRYRRQVLSLKSWFSQSECTALLLDTHLAREASEFQLETLAHGVMNLEQVAHEFGGSRRRLRIEKLRGVPFLEGYHDFRIRTGGLEVYPRLASEPQPDRFQEGWLRTPSLFRSGIPELDNLTGGGLQWGSTTMFLGPAGVGKSTLASSYVLQAVKQERKAAVFLFEEGVEKWLQRTRWLGARPQEVLDSGYLMLRQVDPAELGPGEFSELIRRTVDEGASIVVIDSINGYRSSMRDESFLTLYLHQLLSFLNQRRVLTMLVAAQHGFIGDQLEEPAKLSYLADNVVVLRYFEAYGLLRKAIAMIKNRTGSHDRFIRELHLSSDGVRVGQELRDFQGILGGELVYTGGEERLIDEDGGSISRP